MADRYLSWVEIDLDALAWNVRGLKRHVGDGVLLTAVVKGNGYGHGAAPVAAACLRAGADWVSVNRSNEGVELRRAGIAAPILLLGYIMPDEAERVVEYDMRPTVSNLDHVRALSEAARRRGVEVPVHVKLDTGLSRQGVLPDRALDFVRAASRTPHVRVEGLYSHFAVAEDASPEQVAFTRGQLDTYLRVNDALVAAGFAVPIRHIANTAATLSYPETHLDMVRVGSALAGVYPSADVKRAVELRPVLSLKSHVGRVTVFPPGTSISYGRTFVTGEPTRVALVPVGFGDGYRRSLSNRGEVLIRGRRARVLGRIAMDQCMVDATGIPDVALDDEVVLIGAQGGERVSADEVGERAGTIPLDITTTLAPRLPRVYVEGGRVVEVCDAPAGGCQRIAGALEEDGSPGVERSGGDPKAG